MTIISGSGSVSATTPEGANATGSSYPEREGSPSDAAINIWSSEGAPKEIRGPLCSAEGPAWSFGSTTDCWVLEGRGNLLGEALTMILKSTLTPPYAALPQSDFTMIDIAESFMQLRDGHVPTWRTWTIHEIFFSVLKFRPKPETLRP